jgi:glycerate kinase
LLAPMIAGVPHAALLAGTATGARLSAASTLAAVARGVGAAGAPVPDTCALAPLGKAAAAELHALLAELDFDARMRVARALIVCEGRLEPTTLASTAAFELATRARQAGVPAFAIAGSCALSSFEARMLDLQAIEQARSAPALQAAGHRIALLL